MKRLLLILAASITVTGCASTPQSQYYTLSGAALSNPPAAQATFVIHLSTVKVPQQVDRPQIVLGRQGSTEVTLLNDSQWAAPLTSEIRDALSHQLSQRLGALEVEPRAAPKDLPLWMLSLTVNRFDSIYERVAVLDVTWRQAPRNGAKGPNAICSATIEVPVGPGVESLVAGHQQALSELAGLMANKLRGQPLEAGEGVVLKGCV
ncbi:MAG TPA: ABC-type transport auxiliary lipoprotein family protein [Pusillimonas sp.]|uniref:PqiC family protein n=1 Tax=Pusillimonas sp. TaxID=3040095 RepID=UPI002B4B1044|nr:ABC-type transport auxiliary lipoprotein family protein [Pusillimonas sp.]HLU20634.1 ABC-type transport auxiliary lipoprotein family protein [Pusillimonas sp.]